MCVGHKTDRQTSKHVWREHSAYECDRHKTELTDRLTDRRNLDEWTARHTDTFWEDGARM